MGSRRGSAISQAVDSVEMAQTDRPFGGIRDGGGNSIVELATVVGNRGWYRRDAGDVFDATMGLAANFAPVAAVL